MLLTKIGAEQRVSGVLRGRLKFLKGRKRSNLIEKMIFEEILEGGGGVNYENM